jgi:hypothetical protein
MRAATDDATYWGRVRAIRPARNLDGILKGSYASPIVPALAMLLNATLARATVTSIDYLSGARSCDLARTAFEYASLFSPPLAVSVLEGLGPGGMPRSRFAQVADSIHGLSNLKLASHDLSNLSVFIFRPTPRVVPQHMTTDQSPRHQNALKYMVYEVDSALDSRIGLKHMVYDVDSAVNAYSLSG